MGMQRRPGQRVTVLAVLCGLLAALGFGCAAPQPEPPSTPAVLTPTPSATAERTPGPEARLDAWPAPLPLSPDADTPADPPARAVRGGPPVRLAPDTTSPLIAGLYYDTALPLLEETVGADGVRWYRIRLWGVLDGWIRGDQVTTDLTKPVRPFWEGGGSGEPPRPGITPSHELRTTGVTNTEVNLRSGAGRDWRVLVTLPAGTAVRVESWATDEESRAWYEVEVGGRRGWVYAAWVDLSVADPLRPLADGRPLSSWVAGKGMWVPHPLLEMADPERIVEASRRLGLTHLFVEAADSGRGFYGREELGRLLPAAQQAGLKVVAWITTSLYDLPEDVELSVKVAEFRSPDGHRVDGIAPDIEQNMHSDDVKAYAEITRTRLGDDRLIVGVIYPAGGWFGREYPIQPILARVCNALAPMAYWKDEQRVYPYPEVYDYIRRSVEDMRRVTSPDYPVHVIGQMYDTFGRNGTGEFSPAGEETQAALQAARDTGAVGISFFQWGTATPREWAALRDFDW